MAKKTLQIVAGMNCGGIETFLMNFLKKQKESAPLVDFFLPCERDYFYTKEIKVLGCNIYSSGFKSKHFVMPVFYAIAYIKRLLSGYSTVHSHYYYLSAPAMFVTWLFRVKKRITHSHGTRDIHAPKILKKPLRWLARKMIAAFSTDLWACSAEAGRALYGPNAKFKVIKNAIDVERFHFKPEVRAKYRKEMSLENSFVLGHVGNFSKVKNHSFIIDIFDILHKKHPASVLLLIGKGPLEAAIEKKVKDLGLQDAVRFLGRRSDVADLCQAMDAFVMPSFAEGLPVAGVEAQAAGLPCFFTDVISKEVNIDDSVFLPIDNARVWADAVIEKALNYTRKDKTEKVRAAGFDMQNQSDEIIRFYFDAEAKP